MKKFLKILVFAFAAVGFAGTLLALALIFNAGQLKNFVLAQINRQLNITLNIGKVDLNLSGLKVENIEVSSAATGELATLKGLEVDWTPGRILRRGNFLQGVTAVKLSSLKLHLSRDKAGKWNWEDLLAASPPTPEAASEGNFLKDYNGIFELRHADIVYQDFYQGAFRENFKLEQASCDFSTSEYSTFMLKGRKLNNPDTRLEAQGKWWPQEGYLSAHLKGEHIPVADWGNYLSPHDEIDVKQGQGGVDLTLAGKVESLEQLQALSYFGAVDFNNVEIATAYYPEPIKNLEGRVLVSRETVLIQKLRGNLGGGNFSVGGRVYDFQEPCTDLQLKFNFTNLASPYKDLPFKAYGVSGEMQTQGSLKNLKLQGEIVSERFAALGNQFNHNKLRFNSWGKLLRISNLSSGGGQFTASGWVAMDNKPRGFLLLQGKLPALNHAPVTASRLDFKAAVLQGQDQTCWGGQARIGGIEAYNNRCTALTGNFIGNRTLAICSSLQGENLSLAPAFIDVKTSETGGYAQVPEMAASYKTYRGNLRGNIAWCGSLNNPTGAGILNLRLKEPVSAYRSDNRTYSGPELKLEIPFAGDARDAVEFTARGTLGSNTLWSQGSAAPGARTLSGQFLSQGENLEDFMCFAPHSPLQVTGAYRTQGSFNLSPDFNAWNLAAVTTVGEVTSRGIATPGNAQGFAHFSKLKLDRLPFPYRKELKAGGELEGDVMFSLNQQLQLNYNFSGTANLAGLTLESGRGNLTFHKGKSAFNAWTYSPEGILALQGEVGQSTCDVRFTGEQLDYNAIISALDYTPLRQRFTLIKSWQERINLTGLMQARGRLTGALSRPRLALDLSLTDGTIKGIPLAMHCNVKLKDHTINLQPLKITAGQGTYLLQADLGSIKPVSGQGSLEITNGDLETLVSLSPWAIPAQGKLNGKLYFKGSLSHPELKGYMAVADGMVSNQAFKHFNLEFDSQNRALMLKNLNLQFDAGKVAGQGSISPSGDLDFELSSYNFPLSGLAAVKKTLGEIEGDLDFTLKVKGTQADPQFNLSFIGNQVAIQNLPLEEVQGNISWNKRKLVLEPFYWVREQRKSEFFAEFDFAKNLPHNRRGWRNALMALKGSTEGINVDELVKFFNPELAPRLSGSLVGNLAFSRQSALLRSELHLDWLNGAIDQHPCTLKFNLLSSDKGLVLDNCYFQAAGNLTLSGELSKKHNQLHLSAREFDLANLSFLLPENLPLGGKLNGSVDLRGALRNPEIKGNFVLQQVYLSKVHLAEINTEFENYDGVFNLKKLNLIGSNRKFNSRLKGTIPWKDPLAEVNLHGEIQQSDLDWLSLFLPGFTSSAGTLTAGLKISGPLSAINYTGNLEMHNGKLETQYLKDALENLELTGIFKDDCFIITKGSGSLGGGNFSYGGEIRFEAFQPKNYKLSLRGSNLLVRIPKYFEGRSDADLNFNTSQDQHILTGKISAHDATLTLNIGQKPLPQEMANLALDLIKTNLELELQKEVWLNFLGSNILTDGTLWLGGDLADLKLSGELNLRRGMLVLPFLAAPFTLYQGKAFFGGSSGLFPYLEAEAETHRGDTVIYLNFSGDLEHHSIDLTSDPPMAKDKIMRVLIGVSGGTDYAGSPANQTSSSLGGISQLNVFQPFTAALSRALSLNDFSFELLSQGLWSMRVAKALDAQERFLITYANALQPTGEIERIYGLEYRLRSGERSSFHLRAAQSNLVRYYFWLQSRYSF